MNYLAFITVKTTSWRRGHEFKCIFKKVSSWEYWLLYLIQCVIVFKQAFSTKAMVKLTDVLTKVMSYWWVACNRCSTRCPSTVMSLRVSWLDGPCVVYYWKYWQRSMDTIPYLWELVPRYPCMTFGTAALGR